MNEIKYIKGDATKPVGEGAKVLVHICNDIGGWGKGFVMAISKKWKLPEQNYRKWYKDQNNFTLGEVQLVKVDSELWVANVIAQHKINRDAEGNPPIRYEALREGLKKVAARCSAMDASVHMPRIGCGLAGGKWNRIEELINDVLISKDIEVTVYDFE